MGTIPDTAHTPGTRFLLSPQETMSRLPKPFGPYQLVERLGAGGMAQVHLAVAFGASGFEKRVAIKTLLPEHRGDGELTRLLISEARLCARLQHRNLVQVQDLGVADGTYYVRMEYVDGDDLASLSRHDRPSAALALLICEEISLALHYIHHARDENGRPLGLIHRDISPSNILLSRSGEVKLTDFGVAKATQMAHATDARVRKGKYTYMSPEQVAGERLTPRSDIFSLGVTLMKLLVGRKPYSRDTVLETMDAIREARPPHLPEIREDLRNLIHQCLKKAPEERFQSALEFRGEVARIRRTLPPMGSPELAAWVNKWV